MQQIYANARQVIVWLGEENYWDSDPVLSGINLVSSFLDTARTYVDVDLETFSGVLQAKRIGRETFGENHTTNPPQNCRKAYGP
jgi:hypothetical protein